MDATAYFKHPGAELKGQIRIGRVSSSDAKAHTAQVQFFEQDGFVSHDLAILVTRPKDYSTYEQNTLVLCLLIDGIQGGGFVLGAFYGDNDAPPLNDSGARSVAGDDLRLGAPDASDKISLAPKCKDNFDKINSELTKISTTLASLTGGITTTATFGTPYSKSYSPSDPAAENVSAK